MKIWGITKKYKSLSWWDNFMSGHISIGRLTIFGENAMCWTVQFSTQRWGYICFTLPSISRNRRKWPYYFYLSPNGTPWACTYYIGGDKYESLRAKIRKMNFGHGFNTSKYSEELYALNQKFEWFRISEYDIYKFGRKDSNQ